AVRDRPQAVVPWALRSRSQVSETDTNLPSFSGSSRNTLPRCGQPGIGRLSENESHLGGCYGVTAQRTDNGDRLLQLCSDNRLFLANTNFRHKENHLLTWRPPKSVLLNDNKAKNIFQEQLEKQLGDRVSDSHLEAGWNDIKKAVETAMISASKVNHKARMKPWISVASTELMDARKLIPPGSERDEERSELKRRLIKSLRNDREQWWVAKAETMEKAAAIGNSRQLFRLIKETGIRDPNVSETISENDGIIIHSQSRRLDRWAEHFRDQFNWPSATLGLPTIPTHPEWQIDLTPPSLYEIEKAIGNLKRSRAAGPDRLTPNIFKDGGRIWELGVIPSDWSESLIVPIYKKGQKSSCDNHRGISLTNIVSKLLASIILRRLTRAREEQTRENQDGFRPGRGCVDHIFTLRQVLEHRHTFRRPTIVVFLDLKAEFDS
ncbi:polyprotein, partial [Schistosoma japonicum]